jgi:hypothetical protein
MYSVDFLGTILRSDTKYDFKNNFNTSTVKYSQLDIEFEFGDNEIIFTEKTSYLQLQSATNERTQSRWILKGNFTYDGQKKFTGGTVTSWATEQHFSTYAFPDANFFYGKDLSSAPLSITTQDLAFGAGSRLDFSDYQEAGFDPARNPSTVKSEDFAKYLPSTWVANPFGQNLISSGNTTPGSSKGQAGGSTTTIGQASTYAISESSTQVNEGDTLTTTLTTTDVITGTTLYYQVVGKGINTKDFSSGVLKGTLTVGADGTATLTHSLKEDKATEGSESLTIKIFSDKKMKKLVGQSGAVTIADTSAMAGKTSGSRGGKMTTKDPITGSKSGPDQGTWEHSNYGVNVFKSEKTSKQYLSGGRPGTPVYLDVNKNLLGSDSVDKLVGYVSEAPSGLTPAQPYLNEALSGTWKREANSSTIIAYWGSGAVAAYLTLTV